MTTEIPGVGPSAPTETLPNGAKQSASPYRMDLLPQKTLLEVSKILAGSAIKYGENNWRGLSIETNLNHALVHIFAWLAGDRQDDHLNHATCRLMFAGELEQDQKMKGNMPTQIGPCQFCGAPFKNGERIQQVKGKNYHQYCVPK